VYAVFIKLCSIVRISCAGNKTTIAPLTKIQLCEMKIGAKEVKAEFLLLHCNYFSALIKCVYAIFTTFSKYNTF